MNESEKSIAIILSVYNRTCKNIEFAETCLMEQKLGHLLTEAISEKDLELVKTSFLKLDKSITALENMLVSLGYDESSHDTIKNYISSMKKASLVVKKQFKNLNLTDGIVASFWGQKFTAPGVITIASLTYSRIIDITARIEKTCKQVISGLSPLITDENDKKIPLKELFEKDDNELDLTIESLNKAFEKSLTAFSSKESLWSKVKSFFKGAKVFTNSSLAVRKVLPEVEMSVLAIELADMVSKKSLNELLKVKIGVVKPDKAMKSPLANAQAAATEDAGKDEDAELSPEDAKKAKEAEAGIEEAVAAAENLPLGKSIKGIMDKWATPYKDDEEIMAGLEQTYANMRKSFIDNRKNLAVKAKEQISKFHDSLPNKAKRTLNRASVDAVNADIDKVITAQLKFENQQRAKIIDERMSRNKSDLDVNRWNTLAGLNNDE